jgi:hypothetical protein
MAKGSGLTYFNARALFQPLISVPNTSVTASYVQVGSIGVNGANILYLSFDGTTDHISILPTASFSSQVYDFKSNDMVLIAGTPIWIKEQGSAPSSGNLSITIVGI